jgi:hypothetical protein
MFESGCKKVREMIDGGLVIAGRLDFNQRLEIGDQ